MTSTEPATETKALKAVVSGSFRQHIAAVRDAVQQLRSAGVAVLSPGNLEVAARTKDFVFLAGDAPLPIKAIEDRHLASIRVANFLWIVCPGGYVGSSTCLEIGVAVSLGVPVYASTAPTDVTISQYVTVIADVHQVVSLTR
ncbi:hypothetical protein X731_03805 [Mesorhizobium sp. L2C054A000]|nr:hypothetical protein X731_03805 [Mesorhizobium sp. L2C054A000]